MVKFVDLFCGGGLGARGAIEAGCQPVFAADTWNIAYKTYRDNFPGTEVRNARVEEIDPCQVFKGKGGKVDLLITSPECTNHSLAKGAAVKDENSRETALTVLVWAKAIRPRWIIIENVPQIKHWKRYDELISGLRRLEYSVRQTIIDAADLGVPQTRKRIFITCELGREPRNINIKPVKQRTAVSSILDSRGTWRTSPLHQPNRAERTIQRAQRAITVLGSGASFLLVYYGSDSSGGWQPLDIPLRTITTLDRFALVEKINGEHRMRMLQPTELAKAMGLSERHRHKFNYGSRRDRVKLCGNGICTPVMEKVINTLIPKKLRRTCQGVHRK